MAILVIPFYMIDANASNLDPTTVTISSSSSLVHAGQPFTFTISVNDIVQNLPTTPTGTISFSDNSADGTFNPQSCILSYGNCTTTYTSSVDPNPSIKIYAGYSGDSTHISSSGTIQVSTNLSDPTTVTILTSSQMFTEASPISISATVTDVQSPTQPLIGILSWNDNGINGIFSSKSCALVNNQCVVTYTAPINSPRGITLNAQYMGDSTHAESFNTALIMNQNSVNPIPTANLYSETVNVTPSSSWIVIGSPITITSSIFDLSGHSLNMTGTVSFSDTGSGTFGNKTCSLVNNQCSVTYTPMASPSQGIQVIATYSGDIYHSTNVGSTTINPTQASMAQPNQNVAQPAAPVVNPAPVVQPKTNPDLLTQLIGGMMNLFSHL